MNDGAIEGGPRPKPPVCDCAPLGPGVARVARDGVLARLTALSTSSRSGMTRGCVSSGLSPRRWPSRSSETSGRPSRLRASFAASRLSLPWLLVSPASAPSASSTRATDAWPIRHAQSRAESPLSSCVSQRLPCESRSETTSTCPCSAARESGVVPNSPLQVASAPSRSSRCASGRSPVVHALSSASSGVSRSWSLIERRGGVVTTLPGAAGASREPPGNEWTSSPLTLWAGVEVDVATKPSEVPMRRHHRSSRSCMARGAASARP